MIRSFFLSALLLSSSVFACTGIRLTASDGSTVNGRTLEFGVPVEVFSAVIPRKTLFKSSGLTYTSKYAAVGAYCFEDVILMDGMNEKGLVAASFYFPGFAEYADVKDASRSLSPVEFPNWILTQFATVEEVKAALASVVIAPIVSPRWGPTPPPFHYVVYDAAGKSIVIEPVGGTLIVHDNELGVLTNSPSFDWHMTNLRNFINLSPYNVSPVNWGGVLLAPFGQGSGMVGLPGDFTPPSRFVRAAIFCMTALPAKNSDAAVGQAFHILNQFDIPMGAARQKNPSGVDYTQVTCVKDPQTLRYYYKTYEDPTVKYIDLRSFDLNAKAIKKSGVLNQSPAVDISSFLK